MKNMNKDEQLGLFKGIVLGILFIIVVSMLSGCGLIEKETRYYGYTVSSGFNEIEVETIEVETIETETIEVENIEVENTIN
jgi:hypothetical protein